MNGLVPSAKKIIEETEGLTGKKFRFVPMERLSSHAIVKIARKTMKEHIVYYRSANDDIINHIISHECGHIIRLFRAPESMRVMPYSGDANVKAFRERIADDLPRVSRSIPAQHLEKLLAIWLDGTIMQITNLPVDVMIELWLYRDYPDLREVQMRSLTKQWEDAKNLLGDTYRHSTPEHVYTCVNLMNYAYLRLLGLGIGHNFIKPYSSTPYINRGKELAALTESITDEGYAGDLEKINKWAEYLEVTDWFGWIDFETIPEGYEESI